MAKKKEKKGAVDDTGEAKLPALTAQTFALVKSLKKVQRRVADYANRMETGEKAEVIVGSQPRSIVQAIRESNTLADAINKILDAMEKDI